MELKEGIARLNDGTEVPIRGIPLRKTIEGKYQHFLVHPKVGSTTGLFSTITERSTGLWLDTLFRYVREPSAAKRLASQRIDGLLAQGLGPSINERITEQKK